MKVGLCANHDIQSASCHYHSKEQDPSFDYRKVKFFQSIQTVCVPHGQCALNVLIQLLQVRRMCEDSFISSYWFSRVLCLWQLSNRDFDSSLRRRWINCPFSYRLIVALSCYHLCIFTLHFCDVPIDWLLFLIDLFVVVKCLVIQLMT